MCNPISRYTLLRWAVNQDDDVWLSMRGTRHQQLCGHCQQPADSFPHGFYHPPFCETCIRESDTTAWSLSTHHVGLLQSYLATIDGHRTEDPEACLGAQAANESVCRACGCGDNTIGPWTRWCLIRLIVAHAILRPGRRQSTLNSIAALSLRIRQSVLSSLRVSDDYFDRKELFSIRIKLMRSLVTGGFNSCTLKSRRMPIWSLMSLSQKCNILTLCVQ